MQEQRDLLYWRQRAQAVRIPQAAFIDGKAVAAADGATFAVKDPATGRLLADVPACGERDVDLAVAAARRAFDSGVWARMPRSERKAVLLRLAALIETHREELALLETLDAGKPINDTFHFDIPESARTFAWYGEALDKCYDEIAPTDEGAFACVTREPVGVVAAIVPWNYPLMMASWKVAPALAAGNSVILKPAEQSPLTALRLGELACEAGVPAGVFNVLPGLGVTAGQALGRHPKVDCIAFTGSTATGKRFMEYSGQSNLKRVWLECGGKSPHIVFDDCRDLDRAARAAAVGIFANQGEICIAGSRLYVQRSIYDAFMTRLDAFARDMQPGDPLDPASFAGALIDADHLRRVLSFVGKARDEGARLRCGGSAVPVNDGGSFMQPTIFEDVRRDSTLMREEVFGPVLAVTAFDSEEEVVALANDSDYGLGAGLWTADVNRAHRVSRRLQAGLVWVNCYMDGNIAVPFGGVKQSGFGRDKSMHAFDKYTDLKTTWISLV